MSTFARAKTLQERPKDQAASGDPPPDPLSGAFIFGKVRVTVQAWVLTPPRPSPGPPEIELSPEAQPQLSYS